MTFLAFLKANPVTITVPVHNYLLHSASESNQILTKRKLFLFKYACIKKSNANITQMKVNQILHILILFFFKKKKFHLNLKKKIQYAHVHL